MLCASSVASPDPHLALPHHDHPDLRHSASGAAYYVDSFLSHDVDSVDADGIALADDGSAGAAAESAHGGETSNAPVTEVPVYESLPGAANIFYLDFTGDVVTGTDWNEDYEDRPIHALPFDKDDDTTTFSSTELAWIYEIWQRVSEDYAPFNINVTTMAPDGALPIGYRTARIIVTSKKDAESLGGTGETWYPDAGGVAYVGGWVTNRDAPGWVFHDAVPNTAKAIAEATAHELGHIVGLSHHGDSDSDYYNGHGDGEMSWAPIMGAGYRSNLTQWSKGRYVDASNPNQDDIAVITNRHNGISVREDDHGDEATELQLEEDGILRGQGFIELRSDYDTFTFEHPGGPISIRVNPAEVGGNLDIAAVLYRDDRDIGDFVPDGSVSVEIVEDIEAGRYYLEVEGVGHSPAESQGYSDYGSLGAYSIEVSFGHPLVATAGGDYVIAEGTTLMLDASQSIGTDEATVFGWDLDDDGEYDDALGEIVELTWEELGQLSEPVVDQTTFTVSVEVRNENAIDYDSTTVTVTNVAPRMEVQPLSGFVGGRTLLSVVAEDIAADPMIFEWDFGDGGEVHITNSAIVTHVYDEPGEYTVTIIVGDDEGATADGSFIVTIQTPIPGDANLDGQVTFADFLILSANFGITATAWEQGDFDHDGTVGFADFLLLSSHFEA